MTDKAEQIVNIPVSRDKPFLRALAGEKQARPPVWLMRQAGRYLPEYRETRAQAGGFLDLVYNPALAAEVTLQPLRRFALDAAILFSDILVIPQALGQPLRFTAGEGPQLDPVTPQTLSALDVARIDATLSPVYDTISTVRAQMDREGFTATALIGFAGAPWTIACYMAEGQGSRDWLAAKIWSYQDPSAFDDLIALITAATIHYLERQVLAGAEALQLFDSWAGSADEQQFLRYVLAPAQMIAGYFTAKYPHIPLIGFPRGAGTLYELYARESGMTALGLDTQVPLAFAARLQQILPVQGNMDPACLLAGGAALDEAADRILAALGQGPHIFNLGHGIIKETPPDHVTRLIRRVKGS